MLYIFSGLSIVFSGEGKGGSLLFFSVIFLVCLVFFLIGVGGWGGWNNHSFRSICICWKFSFLMKFMICYCRETKWWTYVSLWNTWPARSTKPFQGQRWYGMTVSWTRVNWSGKMNSMTKIGNLIRNLKKTKLYYYQTHLGNMIAVIVVHVFRF